MGVGGTPTALSTIQVKSPKELRMIPSLGGGRCLDLVIGPLGYTKLMSTVTNTATR